MVSARTRQQLPVLSKLLVGLSYVAAKLPAEASRTMMLAIQYDHRRDVDPYGHQQPMVKMDRSRRGGLARRYDSQSHIAGNYYPVVEGMDAIVASDHRASRALQKPFKRRPGRMSHPTEGGGLGTWAKRIEKMNRDLLVGAMMGEEKRAQLKADAETRRLAAHTRRNEGRIAKGLKALPYRTRAVRKDRARIDALVAGAVARAG